MQPTTTREPLQLGATRQSATLGTLLGAAIVSFIFAPILGVISGIENQTVYIWTGAAVPLLAGLSLGGGYRAHFRVTLGSIALLSFFLLMMLRVQDFDSEVWTAFFSVGLCVAIVILAQFAPNIAVMKGMLWGVVIIGTATAIFTLVDPAYEFARNYGWNKDKEAGYLLTSPAISATLGPVLLAARAERRPIFKWGLFLLAAGLTYALLNVLARMSLLSGIACIFLAITFSFSGKAHARIVGIVRGTALLLPLIPIGITLLASNLYLYRRLQRMLDPSDELAEGGRGWIWSSTLKFIEHDPLWGGGILSIERYLGTWPHNAVLEALADLGVPGGLALAALLVSFFWSLWKTMVHSTSYHAMAIHLVALVFAAESLKSGSLYLSRPMLVFAVLAPVLSYTFLAKSVTRRQARQLAYS